MDIPFYLCKEKSSPEITKILLEQVMPGASKHPLLLVVGYDDYMP